MTPPTLLDDEENSDIHSTDEELGDYKSQSYESESQDPSLNISVDSDIDTDEEDMNALVEEAEKLLAAEEVIELAHHELEPSECQDLESEPTSKTEDLKWGDHSVLTEISESESFIGGDSESADNLTFVVEKKGKKTDIIVPDQITDDWLNSLTLLNLAEEKRCLIPETLNQLQHSIEQDDPQEEYKVNNIPSTL